MVRIGGAKNWPEKVGGQAGEGRGACQETDLVLPMRAVRL